MGLDMYLTKKTRVYKPFGTVALEDRWDGPIAVNVDKLCKIEEEIATWRKANQVHKWFVDNVQNGVDDCKQYYVPFEKLKELKTLCQKALTAKDGTLLPPQQGFFFGSYEIDEGYWQDIDFTLQVLQNLNQNDSYYYESSW